IVDMEKSVRIFTSALTWFFERTVPSSRKAKPACIASTITAPIRMKSTSALVFNDSISPSEQKICFTASKMHSHGACDCFNGIPGAYRSKFARMSPARGAKMRIMHRNRARGARRQVAAKLRVKWRQMIPWLEPDSPFPPLQAALRNPSGLLAAGGDLSPLRLLAAYKQGIFPWYGEGDPILWWSPDPRMVLIPEELRVSRSLAKTLRNRPYEIRFDTAFDEVIHGCAQPRPDQPGTWITAEMREAYNRLHRLGHAHSVETWIDGGLAGGLYGVAIGGVFFGEAMFANTRDAPKIALAAFVHQ